MPIQTRGNLGKSTEAIARCEWMSQRGVFWKGYDLDAFNRTLSTTYPEEVVFVEPGPEPEEELIKIFRCLAHSEVTVIDPSAHMNRTILRAMEMVRLAHLCGALLEGGHFLLADSRNSRRCLGILRPPFLSKPQDGRHVERSYFGHAGQRALHARRAEDRPGAND
jgi:hypothetical protein